MCLNQSKILRMLCLAKKEKNLLPHFYSHGKDAAIFPGMSPAENKCQFLFI